MRLIIDTNILHKLFDPGHQDHEHYKTVYHCLFKCKGQIFYGGKTFKKEIVENNKKYISLFIELRKAGKAIVLDDVDVDNLESKFKIIEPNKNFDDPHVIACIVLSKAEILVSEDARADKYIKDRRFYPKKFPLPSIYRNNSHKHLIKKCF